MFTGRLARGLGLGQAPGQTPPGAARLVRAQRDLLLAEVLRRNGYRTFGVTTNFWAGPSAGFDEGFDEFKELDTSRHASLGGGARQHVRWYWEAMRARADDGAGQARAAVLSLLRRLSAPSRRERRPFFLFVNILECHSPYLPPRPYGKIPLGARLIGAADAERYLTYEGITRACLGAAPLPRAAARRMRRLYAACVAYADDWVGGLVASLAAADLLANSLVVLCSDHGENLGESGLVAHALSLDERLLRVPFVVAGPNHSAFVGMRSLAELPSRIGAAVGLDERPWASGLIEGLPVAQWDGFEVEPDRLDEFASRLQLTDEQAARLSEPLTCAVADHLKLVRGAAPSAERLYDLGSDAVELSPVTNRSQISSVAGAALDRLRRAVNHPEAQARGAAKGQAAPVALEEAQEIERKMRLLGYM
jgi:arylsulfatase A-like enzyme